MARTTMKVAQADNGLGLIFERGACRAVCAEPVKIALLGAGSQAAAYTTVSEEGPVHVAAGQIAGEDGSLFAFEDRWTAIGDSAFQVDRVVKVLQAGTASGFRFELNILTEFAGTAGLQDYQFFIPGALYNKNDTDQDGIEDYLHTYVQSYRDDRLPSLVVQVFAPSQQTYLALTRADLPAFDTAVETEQILQRHFVQDTDIGSLGLAPAGAGNTQLRLVASYPFHEPHSFCLNTKGDAWAAYCDLSEDATYSVSYQVILGDAPTLTDAMWAVTLHQVQTLNTQATPLILPMEELIQHRAALINDYYRQWEVDVNGHMPAGYMVHFSPRAGKTLGSLLEYGFAGAQTLLAFVSLKYGYHHKLPDYVSNSRNVIDFFVKHCQLENGFVHGIYDVEKRSFVYWWTGILLPFQHTKDMAELRDNIGTQMVDALSPIAARLRGIEGNYTRSMCEAIYHLLLAYQEEQRRGVSHEDWLATALKFGQFLLDVQGEDGSFHRGYDIHGRALEEPVEWFGASKAERGSGTIFPIEVLAELYQVTGDPRYREAASKAGDFLLATYVESVEYHGGLNDTTHIKSVKIDAVGVMFAMRSLLKAYELCEEPRYLEGAVNAAKALLTWVYLWNVPFPPESLLGRNDYKSTGYAVCDVIPAGSYLDNELLEFTPDLLRIARYTGDVDLVVLAEVVANGMQQALSTPARMYGYARPGMQCEGLMTAYWLSDPDKTKFSGAANKRKGDDNDTVNGLTNGQALYGYMETIDAFGTADYGEIRRQVIGRSRTVAPETA